MRAFCFGVGAAAILATALLTAQDVAARRAFDVTSVKETRSGSGRGLFRPGPTGIDIQNATVVEMVAWAHNMLEPHIAGGPDWVRSTRFDVSGRVDGDPLKRSEVRPMVRALLTARFAFDSTIEQVEKPVYALVRARSDGRLGQKLKPAEFECRRPGDEFGPSPMPVKVLVMDGCGVSSMMSTSSLDALFGLSATMGQLADALSRQGRLDRPVVDKTGINGAFDFSVTPGLVTYDAAGTRVPRGEFALFTSLEDDLGLKLEATRANVDVLVIQRIQQPTQN